MVWRRFFLDGRIKRHCAISSYLRYGFVRHGYKHWLATQASCRSRKRSGRKILEEFSESRSHPEIFLPTRSVGCIVHLFDSASQDQVPDTGVQRTQPSNMYNDSSGKCEEVYASRMSYVVMNEHLK
jgi:hypothetical protein